MKQSAKTLQLLQYNVFVLKVLCLWPNSREFHSKSRFIKDYVYLLIIMPSLLRIFADFVLQILGDTNNVADITENLIALIDIVGMMYMYACFNQKKVEMHNIVIQLHQFQTYGNRNFVHHTERRAILLTKIFLAYGILGTVAYAVLPLYQMDSCLERVSKLKSANKTVDGIHCGIITRARFPEFEHADVTPMFEFKAFEQFFVCLLVSTNVLMITMFLCSILMHTVQEIKNFKFFLRKTLTDPDSINIGVNLLYCIKYHIDIIQFINLVNYAFSKIMIVHLTLTSLVISVLGFEVIMVETSGDKLRFSAHLFGWILLLYLVSFFGQLLINESLSVADCLYDTNWYECPLNIRKDVLFMLMRSQKALKINAASLGSMSLESFLKVMSTAYSYFTLLLKMK